MKKMCMCVSMGTLPHTSVKFREGELLDHSEGGLVDSPTSFADDDAAVKMYFQLGLKEPLVHLSVPCLSISNWACLGVFPPYSFPSSRVWH